MNNMWSHFGCHVYIEHGLVTCVSLDNMLNVVTSLPYSGEGTFSFLVIIYFLPQCSPYTAIEPESDINEMTYIKDTGDHYMFLLYMQWPLKCLCEIFTS